MAGYSQAPDQGDGEQPHDQVASVRAAPPVLIVFVEVVQQKQPQSPTNVSVAPF